jgi:hypothetical protein
MKKKWVGAILAAPILGAVLGYLLVSALLNGWFSSKWQQIEKPPGEALHLVALSQDSIWVRSGTGDLYFNENAATCTTDCWRGVVEIPALPVIGPDELKVTSEACAPALPLTNTSERISECRTTLWVDYNYIFALREDGRIYLWKADLYQEWAIVLLFTGVCGGALALFVPTFVAVLLLVLLNRRSGRLKSKPLS